MRISDWSSDVCSSDAGALRHLQGDLANRGGHRDRAAGAAVRTTDRGVFERAGDRHITSADAGDDTRRADRGERSTAAGPAQLADIQEDGRAACRESEWEYVKMSGVAA